MSGEEARASAMGAAIIFGIGLIGAAAIILLSQFLFGAALRSPSIAALSPAALEGGFTLILFALLALVAGFGLYLGARRPVLGPHAVAATGMGIVIGMAGLGAAIALSAVAGAVRGEAAAMEGGVFLLFMGTLLTIFQTGVEELYFRGWMQPALQAGWGRWPGLAATAVAFAGLHFVNGSFNPMSLLTMTLAGLFFGLLAEKSGGLALPIGAHFGWNWAEEMVTGAAPNQGIGSFGAFYDISFVGSSLWGGSEDGLNASLSAAFVLAALIAIGAGWRGFARLPDRP